MNNEHLAAQNDIKNPRELKPPGGEAGANASHDPVTPHDPAHSGTASHSNSMQNVIDKIELMFAALGAFLGWFFGGFDGFLYALIIFVVMDYFTGILAAGVKHELSSEVGFKGIAKKVCIFVLVGIANIVDTQVIMNGSAIRTAVIFFYLSNEGLSVLENAAVIGLPIPEKLKAMLIQLADEKKPPEDDDAEADE